MLRLACKSRFNLVPQSGWQWLAKATEMEHDGVSDGLKRLNLEGNPMSSGPKRRLGALVASPHERAARLVLKV